MERSYEKENISLMEVEALLKADEKEKLSIQSKISEKK
jgi:hypothetical protein